MYFPLFFDLSDKEFLVVGGGHIARRRIRVLVGYAYKVRIVSKEISSKIRGLISDASKSSKNACTLFEIKERGFVESDLEGADFVLAATDDEKLNARIVELCRQKGIPVNACTDADLCDFQFPSVIEDGETVIGINASGKDHALVKETRKKIEKMLGSEDLSSKYE